MKTNASALSTPVGVIGPGSFGIAISKLLSENVEVLLYCRQKEVADKINATHQHLEVDLSPKIIATNNLEEIGSRCTLIFPIVPSVNFREMMKDLAPHLRPYHILIHGTKGFDLTDVEEAILGDETFTRKNVHTMSEVMLQESAVLRVGCLSGPNLSSEIFDGQPTATVIGSEYREVIKLGRKVLQSKLFHVFGTYELLGAELAGAFKNAFAIGSGVLSGLGMGKNIQAMLITRGLTEMVHLGKAMGASSKAFLGTAGIGDLVATATSSKSRNFNFGYRLAQGQSLEEITQTMPELAEGIRTIKIMKQLGQYYNLHIPICEMLHSVVFEDFNPLRAINYLMNYPYAIDVDFLEQ